MTGWLETLPKWATAWAAVRGREATAEGPGIRTLDEHGSTERILSWPGDDAVRAMDEARSHHGTAVTLVCDESADLLDYASSRHLVAVRQTVLLTAPTAGLDTSAPLPENAGLAQAPLELYDVVEVSVFGHPVASGRIRIEDDVAVIGALKTLHPEADATLGRAVLAALVEEAYVHGADTLHTIVSERQVAGYTSTGWTVAAHVIIFHAAP